jgi:hypothetical protein
MISSVEITRRVPAGILGRRAAVALMTGCEALLTMYRGENREVDSLFRRCLKRWRDEPGIPPG